MAHVPLPAAWLNAASWEIVREFIQWLPATYAERKQTLLYWSSWSGVTLTREHYEAIARPGEELTQAGRM